MPSTGIEIFKRCHLAENGHKTIYLYATPSTAETMNELLHEIKDDFAHLNQGLGIETDHVSVRQICWPTEGIDNICLSYELHDISAPWPKCSRFGKKYQRVACKFYFYDDTKRRS